MLNISPLRRTVFARTLSRWPWTACVWMHLRSLLLAAALLCCVDAQSEGGPGSVASLRRQAFAAVNAHNPYEAARLFGHVAELEPGVCVRAACVVYPCG